MKIKTILEGLRSTHFDVTTTGRPTPDDILFKYPEYWRTKKKKEGVIKWMSPDEYVEACRAGFRSIGETGAIESGRSQTTIKEYAQMMKDGIKFHLPILDYRGYGDEKSFSQEGLHRVFAAKLLGDELVPVAILKNVE
jgi:hypothetical protein